MSEIGSGTGSSYPTSLDTDTTLEINAPSASKTKARAEVVNDLGAAIIAVQTELGTDPAGTKADVKTFLQTEHDADGTHGVVTATSISVPIITSVTSINTFPVTATPTINTIPVADQTGGRLAVGWMPVGVDTAVRPCFDATLSGNQTISSTTLTKLTLSNEIFDTNTNYDASTNYRFTPTVAGKYLFNLAIFATATSPSDAKLVLEKNGAVYRTVILNIVVNSIFGSFGVESDANGTTDYFEAFVYIVGGGTITILRYDSLYTTTPITWFTGCRVGI